MKGRISLCTEAGLGAACPPTNCVRGCQDRQSICLHQCPGLRSRAASSLPGGRQRIPTHPSAFRWSRQEPPQSCLEGITVFEEARARGWGKLHSKQISWRLSLKTTDARREEEGGQGRVCLSLCVCVGQCPTVSLGAPSHVSVLMASVQAASWPWKQPFNQPRLQAHRLTQAAAPSYAHIAYAHKQPPHLHICITLHPHTHAAHPQGPVPSCICTHYIQPLNSANPGTHTHTCHIYIYVHI